MGGGDVCTVCHHSYKLHHHNEVSHEEQSEEVEVIDEETQRRFLEAKDTEEGKMILLSGCMQQRSAAIEERKRLTQQLHDTIIELGLTRSYAKLLENQIAVIEQRLEAEPGEESKDLREVKEKLKNERIVIQEALLKKVV